MTGSKPLLFILLLLFFGIKVLSKSVIEQESFYTIAPTTVT